MSKKLGLELKPVYWKVYIAETPQTVFKYLSTDRGREKFWAEQSVEQGESIYFTFPNGQKVKAQILKHQPPGQFSLVYFAQAVHFTLEKAGTGTILHLKTQVPMEEHAEVSTGWVSVLMNLKAVINHDVDLRNHDSSKTWSEGFVDN